MPPDPAAPRRAPRARAVREARGVRYRRMPIEVESPEELGYDTITNNLSESSVADRRLSDLGLDLDLDALVLCYGDHLGDPALREVAVRILGIPGDRFVDHGSVVDLRRVHRLDAPGLTEQVREAVATLGLEPSAVHASGVA